MPPRPARRARRSGSSNAPKTIWPSFQDILELACRRVDELRSTHAEFERRQVTRKKIAVRAECSGLWGVSRCLITDFGEGGLAIVCGHPHAVGDIVRLRWWFGEEQTPAEVDCVIRHVTGTHVGAQFTNVSGTQRARLVASLRHASGIPFAAAA